ncbi:Uncharacterized protein APZ42_002925, partial [Daphnia magna]
FTYRSKNSWYNSVFKLNTSIFHAVYILLRARHLGLTARRPRPFMLDYCIARWGDPLFFPHLFLHTLSAEGKRRGCVAVVL